jgi:hypothetical protein
MDHGVKVSAILADAYCQHCCLVNPKDSNKLDKVIQLGYSLGK